MPGHGARGRGDPVLHAPRGATLRSCWPSASVFACARGLQRAGGNAFQEKAEVDANYVRLMKMLMKSGVYHGLATHDEQIINGEGLRHAENIAAIPSNSRCSTAYGATCNGGSCAKDGECGSIFRLVPSGIPISCVGWRKGRRICFFWKESAAQLNWPRGNFPQRNCSLKSHLRIKITDDNLRKTNSFPRRTHGTAY